MTGTFTAGQVLTAANLNTAINSLTLNAQSGAGYTLVLTDAGKLVTVSNASAQNLTIPLNSSVAYATGTVIEVLNIGAGTWTLTPTGGVTLTGSTSIPTSARVRLTKTGTDTWYANTLGGGGLTLVATSTFTTASAANINGCFTDTFDNYRLVITASCSAATPLLLRARNSSTDETGSVYYHASFLYASSSANNASNSSGSGAVTNLILNASATTAGAACAFDVSLFNTRNSSIKLLIGNSTGVSAGYYGGGPVFGAIDRAAFDGFTLFASSGTITGTVRVYGYQNS